MFSNYFASSQPNSRAVPQGSADDSPGDHAQLRLDAATQPIDIGCGAAAEVSRSTISHSASSERLRTASASSSLSSSLQRKLSLGSLRSASGMLPCLTVIRVAPPVAEASGAGSPNDEPGAAAATISGSGGGADGASRGSSGHARGAAATGSAVGANSGNGNSGSADTRQRALGAAAPDETAPAANAATSGAGSARQPGGGRAAAAAAQDLLLPARSPARYTKTLLKAVLQCMGCKPRHAHKVGSASDCTGVGCESAVNGWKQGSSCVCVCRVYGLAVPSRP